MSEQAVRRTRRVRLDTAAAATALKVRLKRENLPPGCIGIENVVIKPGPQAFKTASLLSFSSEDSTAATSTELRFGSWSVKKAGAGYDFTQRGQTWSCENLEIDALAAFLTGQLSSPGVYHRIDASSPLADVLRRIEVGEINDIELKELADILGQSRQAISALAESDAATLLLDSIQLTEHHRVIERLTRAVGRPSSPEGVFQRILEENLWLFGGRYVEQKVRKQLSVLDKFDIPLLRPDGSLHIVELKRANIPELVLPHRSHHIVGPDVNEAVGQAMNYLRTLDEHRATILADLKIECRRASATVLIGAESYCDADRETISETLRTFNSHMSRVEVMTYSDLIRSAKRSLEVLTQRVECESGDGED